MSRLSSTSFSADSRLSNRQILLADSRLQTMIHSLDSILSKINNTIEEFNDQSQEVSKFQSL